MKWQYDDGGRAAAGFKGNARDCVTRSIAIVTGIPYREVYDAINQVAKAERRTKGRSSARSGVNKITSRKYLKSLGYTFTPTMGIGTGCRVHLHDGELPKGRLIVSLSRHYTAVIDGVIHDTFDPQREVHVMEFNGAKSSDDPRVTRRVARRCVYGYWTLSKV